MDLRTRKTRRLTNSPSIETAPSFSPDGQKITFESDRGGTQQIYVMSADGSGVQRISFGDGRYASPVWSPRRDLIAFTKLLSGRFYIGVRSEEHTSELQSLIDISYAVFCLKKKNITKISQIIQIIIDLH